MKAVVKHILKHRVFQPALLFLALLMFNSIVNQSVVAQTFTSTGSMTTNRDFHTATLLPNGKVLVVGGNAGSDSTGNIILSSAELYDPASGTWTATGSMASTRGAHTTTLLTNGIVMVAGGTGGGTNGILSTVELYDPASGTWTPTNSMVTARTYFTATLLTNGMVLAAGGNTPGTNDISSAELFNPTTGRWTLTGSMTTNRAHHTATLMPNGKVLVVGGGSGTSSGDTPIPGAELYDPTTGTWTATGSPNTPCGHGHTANVLPNGKVLVISIDAELYDPTSGTWATLATGGNGHESTATLLPNGTVLQAGGGDSPILASAEIYDPATGLWTATASLNVARMWHTATLLTNGSVLIAGGGVHGDGTPATNSAELYGPIARTPPTLTMTSSSKPPGGAFQFAFASIPHGTNTVLTTTNIALAVTNWSVLGVASEFSPGLFIYTDPQATNIVRRLYRVRSP